MHSDFLLRDFCCQVAGPEMYADDVLQLVFTVVAALPLQSRLKPAIGRYMVPLRDDRLLRLIATVMTVSQLQLVICHLKPFGT